MKNTGNGEHKVDGDGFTYPCAVVARSYSLHNSSGAVSITQTRPNAPRRPTVGRWR